MKEKTRSIIERVVIPSILAIALVAVAFYAAEQRALADEYKTATTNIYSHAFTDLAAKLNEMETALGKLRVAGDRARLVLLLDDVWRLSGSCVSLMAQLPSYHLDTAELNRFIIQLGDYAYALTKKALADKPVTGEDMEQLSSLYEACRAISEEVDGRLSSGDVPIALIASDEYYSSESGQYESDESISKYPTLIYDGPFSDSAARAEARGLSGGVVTVEEAQRTAAEYAGLEEVTFESDSNGVIPAYDFRGEYPDGREVDISITKTGGMLLWAMSSATGGGEEVPDGETAKRLKDAALEHLEKNGYAAMQATYAQYYAGAALINFAATENGVIIYNDLVKVWVDASTFEPIGMDARNYIFSHTARDIPTPALNWDEAQGYASPLLEIESRALALIPLSPEVEALCYEFKGKCGGSDYIVYINALTGAEEQIFEVVDSGNGQLVI